MQINHSGKKRVFDIIQIGTRVDVPSQIFDYFLSVMILTNICVTFMRTFQSLQPYSGILSAIELVTILIFIVEYVLRFWTSDLLYPYEDKARARKRFALSFYGIVDLLTIVSYFAPLYSNGIVALRMIRVMRILRLFRVKNSFDAFNVVAEVVLEKRKQLLSSICMIAILMLAASLCMYGFEHERQPDVFKNAFSGIWWAMSTVLTIGYGDIYPVTLGGKLAAIFIALLGVCVVAIPTGVLSAGFMDYYSRLRDEAGIVLEKSTEDMLKRQASERKLSVDEYLLRLLYRDEKNRMGSHKGGEK